MVDRRIDLTTYNNSLFLFGPRQVGKTYLVKTTLKPDLYLDLLREHEFLRYSKNPSLLANEIESLPNKTNYLIAIDEIQRSPALLNEVHFIIENKPNIQFILTGSSARKLKKRGTNLLGGRAITVYLDPFTHEELNDKFLLTEAMHFGTLPKIALEINKQSKIRLLKSYVETYLKEEIQQEALTRNIPTFARFLDLAGFENGYLLNFNNIAREVGVHAKTIKEYFQILEDTLLGFFLYPYSKSVRKKIVSHPKFYFFDCGIVSALQNRLSSELVSGTSIYGDAFEHWVILETRRILRYMEKEVNLYFFRTQDGAEVDLILEKHDEIWAIEIKSSQNPDSSSLRGLKSFIKDHNCKRAICVCMTPRAYKYENIEILPWQQFFKELY